MTSYSGAERAEVRGALQSAYQYTPIANSNVVPLLLFGCAVPFVTQALIHRPSLPRLIVGGIVVGGILGFLYLGWRKLLSYCIVRVYENGLEWPAKVTGRVFLAWSDIQRVQSVLHGLAVSTRDSDYDLPLTLLEADQFGDDLRRLAGHEHVLTQAWRDQAEKATR